MDAAFATKSATKLLSSLVPDQPWFSWTSYFNWNYFCSISVKVINLLWRNMPKRNPDDGMMIWNILRRVWAKKRLNLGWINKTSRNESSFLNYQPLFWPVRQSRDAVEHKLSLFQNTPISWNTYYFSYIYTQICIKLCFDQVMVFKS